jgi:hypothetical protein
MRALPEPPYAQQGAGSGREEDVTVDSLLVDLKSAENSLGISTFADVVTTADVTKEMKASFDILCRCISFLFKDSRKKKAIVLFL